MSRKISRGKIRTDLGPKSLGWTGGLRLAKVTRVDPRKLVVDLVTVTGQMAVHEDVQLTFPNAGARHFIGALPEVTDLCVIGYAKQKAGETLQPFILSWVVPNAMMGYDWIISQFTSQDELDLTPTVKEALKGLVGRRRHKRILINEGNVLASSSQGADLLLNESATLANRRGNELSLRDQDQALVLRTLQQFHVGAGFRIYGGMVQRDGTFLPSQMFHDDVVWSSTRQVDASGQPLYSHELDPTENSGALNPAEVFGTDTGFPANINPETLLPRGLFVDASGNRYDDKVTPDIVYGGKPIFRVSTDGIRKNSAGDSTSDSYTEYRIEVAHTSDGRLPVSEETDGVEIDRLPPSPPGAQGVTDLLNKSKNSPMVEFVLGTAIGNDPFGDRESYGVPLKPVLYTKDGKLSPGLVPIEPGDPVEDQAAFLLRVRNPSDPAAPDAFMAITKGGTFRSYFPGRGSKGQQEFYQTGKQMTLGLDSDGSGFQMDSEGSIALVNTAKGRATDNVGVEITSIGGAVSISAGGAATGNPDGADALILSSSQGAKIEAKTRVKIAAPTVSIDDANAVTITANTAVQIKSGTSTTVNTNTLGVTVTGRADYTYGGPKDGLATNGPSRVTTFAATPLTGAIGGVVDDYTVVFGGRKETFLVGRHDTQILMGSYNVSTAAIPLPTAGFGDGVNLSAGPLLLDQKLELASPLGGGGATLTANLGNATLRATKGQAVIQGVVGVSVMSPTVINMTAPLVQVVVPTATPGGVLSDGCIDGLTGRPFLLSGTVGVATFRAGA